MINPNDAIRRAVARKFAEGRLSGGGHAINLPETEPVGREHYEVSLRCNTGQDKLTYGGKTYTVVGLAGGLYVLKCGVVEIKMNARAVIKGIDGYPALDMKKVQ